MTSEPTRPEDASILVHAYLDGELSVSESVEVERLIAADSALAAEAAAVGALKRVLQTKLPRESLPPNLAARIADRVGLAVSAVDLNRAGGVGLGRGGSVERADVDRNPPEC
jgi:anti-sigma factor RsiW